MMSTKHKDLQDTAILFLYSVGCSAFAKEVPTCNGNADALGIKTRDKKNDVYYIECKASRSDLVSKKQKRVYDTATGVKDKWCWMHDPNMYRSFFQGQDRTQGWEDCGDCKIAKALRADTGIDFYYIVVADGVKVKPSLYPDFGVIDERGSVVRRAKRMIRRDKSVEFIMTTVAHVLVYKVYGKLYQPAHL